MIEQQGRHLGFFRRMQYKKGATTLMPSLFVSRLMFIQEKYMRNNHTLFIHHHDLPILCFVRHYEFAESEPNQKLRVDAKHANGVNISRETYGLTFRALP